MKPTVALLTLAGRLHAKDGVTWLVLTATAIVVAACSSAATPTPLPVAEQRVVYVSDDNAIFTINSDGSSRRQIVGSAFSGGGVFASPLTQESALYTWPTWSPAGDRLVVSRAPGPIGRSVAVLALIEPPSSEETYVHVSRRGRVDRVADGAFHYELWSPDGEKLALIAPNANSSGLELTDAALDGGDPEVIASDAPLYIQWSPDSQLLAVHDQQQLIIRDRDGDREDLQRPSLSYRVPSFSADSASIAFVGDIDGEEHLISREIESGEETRLWRVSTDAVFAWSPTDSEVVAATVRSSLISFDYDGLAVFDVNAGVRRVIYEGEIFAFWWSPDGSRIAIVTEGHDFFQWEVIDVASGDVRELTEFRPAPDFITYLQFFDQFGPSHQVWSADSTAVVFAGAAIGEGRPRRRNQAWVIDVTGERDPEALADARQAYFVPTSAGG